MTKPELEYIQTVCHDWLRQPGTTNDSRRTISPSSALSRTVQLKITVLLTFDDVLIKSVVDAETGACHTKLMAKRSMPSKSNLRIFRDTTTMKPSAGFT